MNRCFVSSSSLLHFRPILRWQRSSTLLSLSHGRPSLRYSSSSTSSSPTPSTSSPSSSSSSISEKLKTLWKQYGMTAIGTYAMVYGITYSSFYVALENNMISFNAVNDYLASKGYDIVIDPAAGVDALAVKLGEVTGSYDTRDFLYRNPKATNLLLAFVMTSFTDIIRIPLVIAIVPSIARGLGLAKSVKNIKK